MSHLLLVAVALGVGDNSSLERPAAERAALEFNGDTNLQGTWCFVAAEVDGKALDKLFPEFKDWDFRITFNNGKCASPNEARFVGGTYTVDPQMRPRRLTVVEPYDKVFKCQDTWSVLYDLNTDTLRLCGRLVGNECPKEFTSKGQWVATFRRDKTPVLVVAFLAAALAADKPAADKPKTDKERLQGTWAVMSVEYNGEVLKAGDYYSKVKDMKFTFKDDSVKNSKEPNDEATYKIDADKKPPTLDIMVKGEKNVETLLMIYEFKDGDILHLCMAPEKPDQHAKDFTSKDAQLLLILKREEKKPEK